jgi:hypothetical protein
MCLDGVWLKKDQGAARVSVFQDDATSAAEN